MSEAEYAIAACIGKRAFPSIALARKAAGRRKGRNVYRCQACGDWHVGSVRPGKEDRRRELLERAERYVADYSPA